MKKFLSLVLALVMTMSLVTVSAGAKDFTDSAELSGEQYEEAVNVMSEMGIIDGYSDGDFRPQGTLTRQAAAKIIACMMLGKTTAESLGTSAAPFKDVPAGSSFAGYIAFCVERGLISGYADGTFRPTGTLTGFAFLKMLLGALGYDQSIEGYTGTNWTVNVAGRAYEIGLTDGNDNFVGSKAATREEAALYAVNTLQATLVEYENKGSSITINGIEVVQGASAPTYVTSSIYNQATSINDDKDNASGDYTVEFAERYQTDLRLDGETDVFGRPARVWSWKGEEIGTYVDYSTMVAEYTTTATGKEMYEAIGKTAFEKYDFDGFVDGKENHLYEEISRNNKGDVAETGNGALTQIFVDSDAETVVVTVINTYLADAETDYNTKKDEVSFDIHGLGYIREVSGEDFDVEDITEGDFVLVNYSYETDEIEVIDDVEILSDVTITRFTSDDDTGNDVGTKVSSVTADGTKYDASKKLAYEEDTLNNYTDGNLKDKTYNIYLDQYGYAIGVEEVEGADNYLFMTGINSDVDYLATANYEANVLLLDGTSEVVKVKSNDDVRTAIEAAAKDGRNQALINTWFKYTVNNSGVYTLDLVAFDLDKDNDVAQHRTTKVETEKIDERHISLVGAGDERIYGTEDTVYLVAGLDTVRVGTTNYGVIADADEVIVGVDNTSIEVMDSQNVADDLKDDDVPLVSSNCVGGTYALYDDDGVVIAAVVVGESTGVAENVVYVISSKASEERFSDGEWGWTREVVLNGELVDLNEINDEDKSVLADEMKQGNWYTVKYDADGNVKKATHYTEDPKETYDGYAENFTDAVAELREEDLVVLEIDETRVDYSKYGRSLFDWSGNTTDEDDGIFVISDVKFVLRQESKNKTTTEEYVGWNQLKSTLDTLNENPKHYYDFSAVIEDGRITSVVIVDRNPDADYDSPSGTGKTVTIGVGTTNASGVMAVVKINGETYNVTTDSKDNQIKVPTGENVTVEVVAVGGGYDPAKTTVTVNKAAGSKADVMKGTNNGWIVLNIAEGDVLVINPAK